MSDWDNFWNDVGNAVEDAVEWVGDAAEDVAEVLVDAAEDVAEVIVDVAETVADWTLTVADAVIFDPVDFITGGVIDVDYADGQLTGELNLGIASVGISVGEQGFDAHAGFDLGIAAGEMSFDSDAGFAMSGSIGVDWGPLPYAEGHMNIGTDGTVSIGGEIQATLPLPFGSIGGEASGELYRNADGTWGATSEIDVLLDGPLDTGASFHNDASVELGPEGISASTTTDVLFDGPLDTGASLHSDASVLIADGDVFVDAGFEAAATGLGGQELAADAHAGFSSATDDAGNRASTMEADAGISAGDKAMDASVQVAETRSATGERSSSTTSDFDVTGFDEAAVGGGGASFVPAASSAALTEAQQFAPEIAPFADATAEVTELAGSGDLSDAISSGQTDLAQVVDLVEADAFDDFTSAIIGSEITETAAEEVWDDIGQ